MAAFLIHNPGLTPGGPQGPSGPIWQTARIGNGFPGGAPQLFAFRGRDSGSPTVHYVTWTSNTPTGAYPGTPPFGGPVVDIVVRRIK